VRADRAFGLAKVYASSEAFLRREPAAATDMLQIETSFKARLFSLSADRMVYEANPAAISSGQKYGCLYINAF
jgi:hypothetical protein